MNNRCSGSVLRVSISSIINFYRLSMPIDQLLNEFKSQTFGRPAKWVYVHAGTCGIPRFFNANRWQAMSFDNFCVIIDWSSIGRCQSMPINQQSFGCHRLIDWFSDHRFHRLFKPWILQNNRWLSSVLFSRDFATRHLFDCMHGNAIKFEYFATLMQIR